MNRKDVTKTFFNQNFFSYSDVDINRSYYDVTLTTDINYHGYVAKEFDGVSAAAKCKVKCDMEGRLVFSFFNIIRHLLPVATCSLAVNQKK